MSWVTDNSGGLIASGNEVKMATDHFLANAMWIDHSEDSDCTVWRFEIKVGDGMWVGVATEEGLAHDYRLKGLMYGGPGNLSDGGSLSVMG